jgi:hypothetical protein
VFIQRQLLPSPICVTSQAAAAALLRTEDQSNAWVVAIMENTQNPET